MNDEEIINGLKQLPSLSPRQSVWSTIASSLAVSNRTGHSARIKRWPLLEFATAASLLVGISLATLMHGYYKSNESIQEINRLMRYSQIMETRLQNSKPESRVYKASQATAISEIEDMISIIDRRLINAQESDEINLWRTRLILLDELIKAHMRSPNNSSTYLL